MTLRQTARAGVLAAVLLAVAGVFSMPGAIAADPIGTATRVVGSVYGNDINARLVAGSPLQYGQQVRTGRDSAAELMFVDDTVLMLGERAEIVIDDYVYDPAEKNVTWNMESLRGVLRFVSGSAQMNMAIKTTYANVGIRGTAFDLKAGAREMEIAVHEGRVEVAGAEGAVMVGAGEIYAVGADGRGEVRAAMSGEMKGAIQGMLGFLNRMDDFGGGAQSQTQAQTQVAMAKRSDGADALKAAGAEQGVVMQTTKGMLVIETLSEIAPAHVARIVRLANDGFYDGRPFYSVKPGFAVEVGPPDGDGTEGGAAVPLPAELSGATFQRGTVGMVHPADDVNGATSRFFIVLSPQTHLDGKYTVWGRVIEGLDVLDTLKPGNPPADPDVIVKLRVVEN